MQEDYLRGRIDKITCNKKAIDIPGIFEAPTEKDRNLKVLIDGAPGVGKTTLCRKICQDWGSHGFIEQYSLVVLLHLRERKIAKAKQIEEFFYHDDPDVQTEVVQLVRKTLGANLLLIFDGFDELSFEERTHDSLFLDIIKGNTLPQCCVIVTSRPYASEKLHQLRSIIRHVEVLGFTEEQIFECIRKNFDDKVEASKLIGTLKGRQDILSLSSIPINCTIVLYVYKQEDYELPNTLTKLFELFIVHSLKRHAGIRKMGQRVVRKLRDCNLEHLPLPLHEDLDRLCHLAFVGLHEDKMIFQYDDIENAEPAIPEEETEIESKLLGLLTAFLCFSSHGEDMTYQFLHLTIQEFLAARWVSSHMSLEQQTGFIQQHLNDDRFRVALFFLAGITKLKDSSVTELIESLEFDLSSDIAYRDIPELSDRFGLSTKLNGVQKQFSMLIHCIYESGNSKLCHTLANYAVKDHMLLIDSSGYTTFEVIVLCYFLKNSRITWNMVQLIEVSNKSALDTLLTQLRSSSSTGVRQFSIFFSSGREFKPSSLPQLLGSPLFKNLEYLCMNETHRVFVSGCGPDSEEDMYSSASPASTWEPIHTLLRLGPLKELDLCVEHGSVPVVSKYIAPAMASSTCCLKSLYILADPDSGIGSDIPIFQGLKHNTSLKEVYIQMKMIGGNELCQEIGSMLRANKTLEVMTLRDAVTRTAKQTNQCKLWPHLFEALAHGNSTLKVLTLSAFGRTGECEYSITSALTKMLCLNTSLTTLNMKSSYIAPPVLQAVAEALPQNTSLAKFCICGLPVWDFEDTFTTSLAALFQALCTNSSLKTLVISTQPRVDLSSSYFDYEVQNKASAQLAKMLMCNKTVTSVTITGIFTEEQLKQVAQGLVLNGYRTEIDLRLGEGVVLEIGGGILFEDGTYRHAARSEHNLIKYCETVQREVNQFKEELIHMLHAVYHAYITYNT